MRVHVISIGALVFFLSLASGCEAWTQHHRPSSKNLHRRHPPQQRFLQHREGEELFARGERAAAASSTCAALLLLSSMIAIPPAAAGAVADPIIFDGTRDFSVPSFDASTILHRPLGPADIVGIGSLGLGVVYGASYAYYTSTNNKEEREAAARKVKKVEARGGESAVPIAASNSPENAESDKSNDRKEPVTPSTQAVEATIAEAAGGAGARIEIDTVSRGSAAKAPPADNSSSREKKLRKRDRIRRFLSKLVPSRRQ